jgi:hypothetical protein
MIEVICSKGLIYIYQMCVDVMTLLFILTQHLHCHQVAFEEWMKEMIIENMCLNFELCTQSSTKLLKQVKEMGMHYLKW